MCVNILQEMKAYFRNVHASAALGAQCSHIPIHMHEHQTSIASIASVFAVRSVSINSDIYSLDDVLLKTTCVCVYCVIILPMNCDSYVHFQTFE